MDIRLVKFCRKATNNTKSESGKSGNQLLATDYFDTLQVERFQISNSIAQIMGIESDGEENQDDISVQSYPLYCSEGDMTDYITSEKYGDPFADENITMPFLSIIQVHITPEVLAYIDDEDNYDGVMRKFWIDLHSILKQHFASNNCDDAVVYKIYHAMSAGDFAVVIRSDRADLSFEISTRIRMRRAKNIATQSKGLVLYKTYTMLSIGEQVIGRQDQYSRISEGNTFVIRGCYSNKYWNDKGVNLLLKKTCDEEIKLSRLNGRYDFSVQISECDFIQLYEAIKDYKTEGKLMISKDYSIKIDNEMVSHMMHLMREGYLSYINERYLINSQLYIQPDCGIESQLKIYKNSDGIYLDKLNKQKYVNIKQKLDSVSEYVERINGWQKNIKYYFKLLKQLIVLCQTINGLSDTRIYAATLLSQLDIVLDSVNDYFELAAKEETTLEDIEGYLREAVCALNKYAQYVRNNNLQSLQTPNYNLETSVSLEKMMIGYGQFLNQFIVWYENTALVKDIGKTFQKYLPIVVPDLNGGEVSIEVLFPNWKKNNTDDKQKTRLMVINCSTLEKLTDAPILIAYLMHEIAHQFRYEKREERNNVLLKCSVKRAFEHVATKISQQLRAELNDVYGSIKLLESLGNNMMEVYIECREMCKTADSCLIEFQEDILRELDEFLTSCDVWQEFTASTKCFIKSLKNNVNLENDHIIEGICQLNEWVKGYDSDPLEMNKVIQCVDDLIDEILKVNRDNELSITKAKILYVSGIEEIFRKDEQLNKASVQAKFFKLLYKKMNKEWELVSSVLVSSNMQEELVSWRVVGRYLGIDYNTEDNQKILRNCIEKTLYGLRDFELDTVQQEIATYREDTADLFMYKLLSLKPIGYLNKVAYSLPIGNEMPTVYTRRIYNVLSSVTEDTGNRLEKVFVDMFKQIEFYIKKICVKVIEYFPEVAEMDSWIQEMIESTANEVEWDRENKESTEFFVKLISGSRSCCQNLRIKIRDLHKNDHKIMDHLRHGEILYKILGELVRREDENRLDLASYDFIKQDYLEGARRLTELQEEFRKEKMSEICDMIAEYLNNFGFFYESNKYAEMNEKLIMFLESLYYNYKISNAKELASIYGR